MDHGIYGHGFERGSYGTRRYPRGGAGGDLTPVPTGGIPENLNPTPIVIHYASGEIGAHALTTRAEYVVPKDRRLKVLSAVARHMRRVAAGAADECLARALLIRSGNTITQEFVMAWNRQNTVGVVAQDNHNGEFEIYEGDTIRLQTQDGGSGASAHAFGITVIAVEFDAYFRAQRSQGVVALDAGNSSGAARGMNLSPFSYPSIRGGQ